MKNTRKGELMLKIAFYSPHLSERGTETAMYDFAHYNELFLGNESIIIYNRNSHANNDTAISKFKSRFKKVIDLNLRKGDGWNAKVAIPEIDVELEKNKCDILYMQHGGQNNGFVSSYSKNLILCCSNYCEPHGDAYVDVSKWLSDHNSSGKIPYLPIIIDIPKNLGNLRESLGIPQTAFVLGRTGGKDTWNIPWVNNVIKKALNTRESLYFVFQNTPKFIEHDRVKYVKTTADNNFKSMFINTCDGMIHSRYEGESFGQSCAEFSFMNKPVITWHNSREKSHIRLLGDKGIYYTNEYDLYNILTSFNPSKKKDWNCYKNHSPDIAIKQFKKIIENM